MTSDVFVTIPGITCSASFNPNASAVPSTQATTRPPLLDTAQTTPGTPGSLALHSPAEYQVNSAGYVTTMTGQNVLGYGATITNGAYTPNLSGGAANPIVVPSDAIAVMFGPDGSVNYEIGSGTVVTAGFITSDQSKQAGVNVLA